MLDTFDMAIEISRAKLLDYILENVQINNLPIVPKLFFTAAGQGNSVHALVDSVDLALNVGTDKADLVYHVYGATISAGGQSQLGFTDGEIRIQLQLAQGTPFQATLLSAEFATSQTSQINDQTAFFNDTNALLTGMLDTSTAWDLFPGTQDATKNFFALLLLEGRQVSCLDADTVVEAIGTGDITKVTNFLELGDFTIMLSTMRVKSTLLFPAMVSLVDPNDIANDLGISVADATSLQASPTITFINDMKPFLPAPFGSGSIKQSDSGVDIFYDFIDFTLNNGSIAMTAKFHGEGFCAHINNGEADETITLIVVSQEVVAAFSPNPPEPTYSVEFDFWCGLGFIFLASNVALVTGIVVTAILISVATGITVPLESISENPFSVPAFDQITWDGIGIFTEGLVLLGSSSASVGYDVTESRVDISSTITTQNTIDVGPGTYHFPGNLVCTPRDFTYEEYTQDVVVRLWPVATMLIDPVQTTWTVHGQPITGNSGQISYTDLAHSATPPFTETALPNHQITIDYVLNPLVITPWHPGPWPKGPIALSTLQLTIPSSDYNFTLLVQAEVEDGDGHAYSSQVALDIETDVVQFGSDYQQFQQQCGLLGRINLSRIRTVPQSVLHGGEALTPYEVTDLIRAVALQAPAQQAITLAKSLSSTYGAEVVIKAFAPSAEARTELTP